MNKSKLLVEKTIASKEVFNGKLLHVFEDQAELPNGSVSGREWIKHPGACAVVPVFENGDVMMVRQFRYPVKQVFWEVPAGKIDAQESQEQTASRELREETGVSAGEFAFVGHFYPCIGYSDEVIHIYAAWNLRVDEQDVDEDEFVQCQRLPFHEVVKMVHTGEINDGKTVICLLRTWQWWQENTPFQLTSSTD
ncbi:MAG: NUDIX hydrolase [Balneolaceae bacterium]|nr:NUDIX hydrolase [Balneolaceae bacterium]